MIIGKIAEKSRAVGEFCGKVQAQRFLNTESTEGFKHGRHGGVKHGEHRESGPCPFGPDGDSFALFYCLI